MPVVQHVTTQRLHDLLLSFPAAAVAGVQWKVLAQKYEEHHGTSMDWESLGHKSPLDAAKSLLQDVLRVVDTEDDENPSIGVEDNVALSPHPGFLGCWPSLYQALCEIVLENGSREPIPEQPSESEPPTRVTASLMFAQLRPLLQANWHVKFDEGTMGYRNDDGQFRRFKKMRHMLYTVFKLREQRQSWRESSGQECSQVDRAIAPVLEIVPSQTHNDMLLRCTAPAETVSTDRSCQAEECLTQERITEQCQAEEMPTPISTETEVSSSPSSATFCEASMNELQLEVQRLRAENRKLRARNVLLEEHCTLTIPEAGMSPPSSPGRRGCRLAESDETPRLGDDYFDNPFEPPPQKSFLIQDGAPSRQSRHSSSDFGGSTADFGCSALAASFSGCTSANISGTTTPASMRSPFARPGCTYVPMWVPFMNAQSGYDLSIIPSGIVREVCAELESK